MLYKLCDIKQIYGDRTVLDITSLDIQRQKIYTLIGPNGAGKTTLLKILAFLENPKEGEVNFNTKAVEYSDKALRHLRQGVILVDQYPILFTGSVWKNIEFGLKIRKVDKKRRCTIIEEALEMVGMQTFAYEDAQKLSGGETKRVALARALAIKPEVLLCDEPTANVDAENQEIILNILQQSNRENKLSLIFATHYLSQAQRLADKTINLHNGKLSMTTRDNVFSVKRNNSTEYSHSWLVGEDHFLITNKGFPAASLQKGKIYIDPKRINILSDSVTTELDRNVWHGVICRIEQENGWIRLTVDVGLRLDILLKRHEYVERPYHVEEKVTLHITDESLEFYEK